MLHGALAAALTPLRDDAFDAAAVAPYVEFLAGHGLDGALVLGTTGEGVLFSPEERREIAAAFVAAARGKLQAAVHCGAQTTRETVRLAEHAAGAGAVSGLAASFPDAVVPIVREPGAGAGERAAALRAQLQQFPFHAAAKAVLGFRGVPVGPEVRRPLRGLTEIECAEVGRIVAAWSA